VSLQADSRQIAKAKRRELEAALDRGQGSPLRARTPLEQAVTAYVQHIHTVKTKGSAKKDTRILRQVFGPICPALMFPKEQADPQAAPKRKRAEVRHIEAKHLEDITTASLAAFIGDSVRTRGLCPRTANRFREVLSRLFTWSINQGGVRMPLDRNPVAKVDRYHQNAPEIRFLTLPQIDEQLNALADCPQLQTMVAVYIYAGLRREEALWLTLADVDLAAGTYGMIRVQAKTINEKFWQPKTKSNRVVPISSALRAWLDRYAPRPSIGGWYFPSPMGYHFDIDGFSHRLSAANHKAGLPWTCLDYRHTFGSQLAMKGQSLYKISTLMGNSPEVCRLHYAAILPEAMLDTVEFSCLKTPANRVSA